MQKQKSPSFHYQKPGSYKPFLLDLDKEKIFFSGSSAKSVADISNCQDFFYYILDYPKSSGPGLIEVSGTARYAEVLARKRLEETGEMSPEEERLWVYNKQKISKNQARLFYHVIPQSRISGLEECYRNYQKGFMVFDFVSLLWSLLQKMPKGNYTVLALHTGFSVLLLAGTRRQLDLVRRYSIMPYSGFGLENVFSMIQQDMKYLCEEKGRRPETVQWLQAFAEESNNIQLPESDPPFQPWPVAKFELEGDRNIITCVPFIVNFLSGDQAQIGRQEKILRPLETGEKFLWAGLFLGGLCTAYAFLHLSGASHKLEQRAQNLQQQVQAYEKVLESASSQAEEIQYQPTLKLANKIVQAGGAPSYAKLWRVLSGHRPSSMQLTFLGLKYGENSLKLQLEGTIELGLVQAQEVFSSFLSALQSKGFRLSDKNLDMGLDTSSFTVSFKYPFGSFADAS